MRREQELNLLKQLLKSRKQKFLTYKNDLNQEDKEELKQVEVTVKAIERAIEMIEQEII